MQMQNNAWRNANRYWKKIYQCLNKKRGVTYTRIKKNDESKKMKDNCEILITFLLLFFHKNT